MEQHKKDAELAGNMRHFCKVISFWPRRHPWTVAINQQAACCALMKDLSAWHVELQQQTDFCGAAGVHNLNCC